jgi:Flp pilus assembly secretin CpaC
MSREFLQRSTAMRMSRPSPFVLGSLAAIAGAVLVSSVVAADPITLSADQVRIVTFKKPVKTVFVANPIVADITIIDSTRAFVQGKNLGTTQLIALDEQGQEAFNDQVTVLNPPGSVVTLQRGKAQSTLSCIDERCQMAPVVGDAPEPFDSTLAQIAKSEQMKTTGGR